MRPRCRESIKDLSAKVKLLDFILSEMGKHCKSANKGVQESKRIILTALLLTSSISSCFPRHLFEYTNHRNIQGLGKL